MMFRKSILLVLASLTLIASGCATSLTSTTEARTRNVGEVQASVVYQANVHTNVLEGLVDAATSAEEEFNRDSNDPISEESFRSWVDAILQVTLFKPGTGPELHIRTGVYDDFMEGIDVGFKTDLNILKFDAKVQWWESMDGRHAVSTSIGYGHHLNVGNKIISYLTLTDFSRKDFDLQLVYGFSRGEYFRVAFAPHLILSKITPESKIPDWLLERLPDSLKQYDPGQFFKTEWIQYYGLNSNVQVGYKYAFVMLELGLFYMNFTPEVVLEERDYSSAAFSLAGGLSFNYQF